MWKKKFKLFFYIYAFSLSLSHTNMIQTKRKLFSSFIKYLSKFIFNWTDDDWIK